MGGDDLHHPAEDEKEGEEALGREVPVRYLTGDERRGDRTDRAGEPEDPSHLAGREAQPAVCRRRLEVPREHREPEPPHRVLEQHHEREAPMDRSRHARASWFWKRAPYLTAG